MTRDSLEKFIAGVGQIWGPYGPEVVAGCRLHLAELVKAPPNEKWLTALHRDAPASEELYRDPEHGFVLLAHTEEAGLYRAPHDHGRSWVIYAVQRGEIKMGSYTQTERPDGRVKLIETNSTLVKAGQVMVYLPGDIHDTRCVSGPALLFRFTERDLKIEDREEHRVKRYVQQDGEWTIGRS